MYVCLRSLSLCSFLNSHNPSSLLVPFLMLPPLGISLNIFTCSSPLSPFPFLLLLISLLYLLTLPLSATSPFLFTSCFFPPPHFDICPFLHESINNPPHEFQLLSLFWTQMKHELFPVNSTSILGSWFLPWRWFWTLYNYIICPRNRNM